MVDKLLKLHEKPLAEKQVLTEQDLVKIIRMDYLKIYFALNELNTKNVSQILKEFFGEDSETVPYILAFLKNDELCHIGIEVSEPLDLVLHGLKLTFDKLNQDIGAGFAIRRVLRFPASQSFQDRVGAYTEIMRIWIESPEREVMLEFFDIHRPVDILPLNRKNRFTKFNIDIPSITRAEYFTCDDTRRNIFSTDKIWHYAVAVSSRKEVLQIHEYFKTLVSGNEAYNLPFENIVHNINDGSFYSKIINIEKEIELEFVTIGN